MSASELVRHSTEWSQEQLRKHLRFEVDVLVVSLPFPIGLSSSSTSTLPSLPLSLLSLLLDAPQN